jgi:ankyrin repeat protein
MAAAGGHVAVIAELLKAGADTGLRTSKGATAVHMAAAGGHAEAVRALLATGKFDKDEPNLGGLTPLMDAAHRGHVDVATMLVDEFGADAAAEDRSGLTALSYAKARVKRDAEKPKDKRDVPVSAKAKAAHKRLVAFLAGGGVERGGVTPLHRAAESGNAAAVKRLLAAGADAEARGGEDGATPLHLACAQGHLEAVLALAEAPRRADVGARDGEGELPLGVAALNGHADVVEALLLRGAGIEARGQFGRTALHHASSEGQAEAVGALLAMGASVAALDDSGDSPLHLACQEGHLAVAQQLLQAAAGGVGGGEAGMPRAGAEATRRNAEGLTPLDWARRRVHEDRAAPAEGEGAVEEAARAEHEVLQSFLEGVVSGDGPQLVNPPPLPGREPPKIPAQGAAQGGAPADGAASASVAADGAVADADAPPDMPFVMAPMRPHGAAGAGADTGAGTGAGAPL